MNVENIIARIKSRQALVGIIGMGYVGLPLALAVAQHGFQVLGFDVSSERVRELNGGASPLQHIPVALLAKLIKTGTLRRPEISAGYERWT